MFSGWGRDDAPDGLLVVDAGEDVTVLRLLDDADLDHGEEITVFVPDDADE